MATNIEWSGYGEVGNLKRRLGVAASAMAVALVFFGLGCILSAPAAFAGQIGPGAGNVTVTALSDPYVCPSNPYFPGYCSIPWFNITANVTGPGGSYVFQMPDPADYSLLEGFEAFQPVLSETPNGTIYWTGFWGGHGYGSGCGAPTYFSSASITIVPCQIPAPIEYGQYVQSGVTYPLACPGCTPYNQIFLKLSEADPASGIATLTVPGISAPLTGGSATAFVVAELSLDPSVNLAALQPGETVNLTVLGGCTGTPNSPTCTPSSAPSVVPEPSQLLLLGTGLLGIGLLARRRNTRSERRGDWSSHERSEHGASFVC